MGTISVSIDGFESRFDCTKNLDFKRSSSRQSILQLGNTIVNNAWSPIVWADNSRRSIKGKDRKDYFASCSYLALDFDDGKVKLEEAIAWIENKGYQGLIGLSQNHQIIKKRPTGDIPALDRLRVVIPLSRTINSWDLYEYNTTIFARDNPKADSSVFRKASFFKACREIVWSKGEGCKYPIQNIPNGYFNSQKRAQNFREKLKMYASCNTVPGFVLNYVQEGYPGCRNAAAFKSAAALAGMGWDLAAVEKYILNTHLAEGTDIQRAIVRGYKKAKGL